MKKDKWNTGKVLWFNNSSGRGRIMGDDGIRYDVHYSCIQSEDKWETLIEKQQVKFLIFNDPDYSMVESVVVCG